jgi:membrane-associated phospholipid phosphatase
MRKLQFFLSLFVISGYLTQLKPAYGWDPPYAQTALLLGVSASVPFIPQSRDGTKWTNPLDNRLQKSFQADHPDAQQQAQTLSDITLGLNLALPFTQWLLSSQRKTDGHLSADESNWLLYSSVNAFAVNWILSETMKKLTGRMRPSASVCDLNSSFQCDSPALSNDDFKSFPSGHTSFAFTGAAVSCLQQAQLKKDSLAISSPWLCPLAMISAGTTAFLRVRGNAHWFTDITAGAVIGLVSGLVVGPALTGTFSSGGAGQAAHFERSRDLRATPPIFTTLFFF